MSSFLLFKLGRGPLTFLLNRAFIDFSRPPILSVLFRTFIISCGSPSLSSASSSLPPGLFTQTAHFFQSFMWWWGCGPPPNLCKSRQTACSWKKVLHMTLRVFVILTDTPMSLEHWYMLSLFCLAVFLAVSIVKSCQHTPDSWSSQWSLCPWTNTLKAQRPGALLAYMSVAWALISQTLCLLDNSWHLLLQMILSGARNNIFSGSYILFPWISDPDVLILLFQIWNSLEGLTSYLSTQAPHSWYPLYTFHHKHSSVPRYSSSFSQIASEYDCKVGSLHLQHSLYLWWGPCVLNPPSPVLASPSGPLRFLLVFFQCDPYRPCDLRTELYLVCQQLLLCLGCSVKGHLLTHSSHQGFTSAIHCIVIFAQTSKQVSCYPSDHNSCVAVLPMLDNPQEQWCFWLPGNKIYYFLKHKWLQPWHNASAGQLSRWIHMLKVSGPLCHLVDTKRNPCPHIHRVHEYLFSFLWIITLFLGHNMDINVIISLEARIYWFYSIVLSADLVR